MTEATASFETLVLTVNGTSMRTRAATLAELLAELGYGEGRIATAQNGSFVPARARAETKLGAGDRIEVVAPRQGG